MSSTCSKLTPRAPNLLHVLPSCMVGWNELCNPGMSKCLLRFPAWPNDLLHWTQVKFSSLMWVVKWLVQLDQMTSRILSKNASFSHSLRANASSFHFGFWVDWEHQAPWRLSNWMIWEYSFTVRDATRSIIRSQWLIVCDLSGDELNNLTVVTHHYIMYINIQWWESAGDKTPTVIITVKTPPWWEYAGSPWEWWWWWLLWG